VARAALRNAAGIEIPNRDFVLYVLAGYLTVLVPLNYVVFRLLGRLEWAWIAVPIIALGGAATVIKLARLDIGFASSQTELAVLEAHAGYSRGHVTRYSALYSSLSTAYDLHFDGTSAMAAPFSADPAYTRGIAQSSSPTAYRRDKDVRLDDLNVGPRRALARPRRRTAVVPERRRRLAAREQEQPAAGRRAGAPPRGRLGRDRGIGPAGRRGGRRHRGGELRSAS
jgi:hypothetical protein